MKNCPVRKFCCKFTTAILAVAVLLLLCGAWWCHPTGESVLTEAQAESKKKERVSIVNKKSKRKKSPLRNQQEVIQQKLRKLDQKLDQIRRLKHHERKHTNTVGNGSRKN